ncbi:MAG: hypothetical protein V4591_06200 [Bdellovibrionota bacterium]
MTFWHNQKYDELEKTSLKGDFIRGIPSKNFPWLLKNISCTDTEQDEWQIKVFCMSIEGNELSQKVKAQIKLEAQCTISKESLKKIGIEYERLFDLNLFGWNILNEKYTLEMTSTIDKIEEKSGDFYKDFFKKIQEKYNIKKKKEAMSFNIKSCKVSNFS